MWNLRLPSSTMLLGHTCLSSSVFPTTCPACSSRQARISKARLPSGTASPLRSISLPARFIRKGPKETIPLVSPLVSKSPSAMGFSRIYESVDRPWQTLNEILECKDKASQNTLQGMALALVTSYEISSFPEISEKYGQESIRLKRYLSIPKRRILESRVVVGIPSLAAAPAGPDIRPRL